MPKTTPAKRSPESLSDRELATLGATIDELWALKGLYDAVEEADGAIIYTPIEARMRRAFNGRCRRRISAVAFARLLIGARKRGIFNTGGKKAPRRSTLSRGQTLQLQVWMSEQNLPFDRIAHTENFNRIADAFRAKYGPGFTDRQIYADLGRMRRSGDGVKLSECSDQPMLIA